MIHKYNVIASSSEYIMPSDSITVYESLSECRNRVAGTDWEALKENTKILQACIDEWCTDRSSNTAPHKKGKGKGKVNPRTGHTKSQRGSTLSLTSAVDEGGWSTPRPGRFIPGKEARYPLYRRLGGPQGRSERVRKISPPTGIRSPGRPARSELLY
jgi:hypothetical protein